MTQHSDIHNYSTKGKQDLYVQLCNTAHCKKHVIIMGIKMHNSLLWNLKVHCIIHIGPCLYAAKSCSHCHLLFLQVSLYCHHAVCT
jgi:hypothetical protein